jgi:hypothetical protein
MIEHCPLAAVEHSRIIVATYRAWAKTPGGHSSSGMLLEFLTEIASYLRSRLPRLLRLLSGENDLRYRGFTILEGVRSPVSWVDGSMMVLEPTANRIAGNGHLPYFTFSLSTYTRCPNVEKLP